MSYKKLTKSDDKIFAGICGGMAEYLDFDPTVVRVAYATLTLFTAFSGIILYFVLWFIIPKKEITQCFHSSSPSWDRLPPRFSKHPAINSKSI